MCHGLVGRALWLSRSSSHLACPVLPTQPQRLSPWSSACLLLSRGKFIKISHHSSKQSPCYFSCHYNCDSSETLQLREWPYGYEVVLAPRTV